MNKECLDSLPEAQDKNNAGLDNKALPEEFIDSICGGIAAGLEKVLTPIINKPLTSKQLCDTASFPQLLTYLSHGDQTKRMEFLHGVKDIISVLRRLDLSNQAAQKFLLGVIEEIGKCKLADYSWDDMI